VVGLCVVLMGGGRVWVDSRRCWDANRRWDVGWAGYGIPNNEEPSAGGQRSINGELHRHETGNTAEPRVRDRERRARLLSFHRTFNRILSKISGKIFSRAHARFTSSEAFTLRRAPAHARALSSFGLRAEHPPPHQHPAASSCRGSTPGSSCWRRCSPSPSTPLPAARRTR